MSDEPDTPDLRPAAESPWYVLMTVAGEQPGNDIDWDLHARNRRYWNGWQAQALNADEKARLIEDGRANAKDLAELADEEQAAIDNALGERCPDAERPFPGNRVNLRSKKITTALCANGFLFPRFARFTNATFSELADFGGATFSGPADFEGATFSSFATFGGATFSGPADFSDATFQAATSFKAGRHWDGSSRPVVFQCDPPEFYGATLHEDTNFTDVEWPPVPEHADPQARRGRAIQHRRAYERLKLLMDSQKKVADELMFQRLELRCREVEAPRDWRKREWWVARASQLYRVLSNYGWDPVRPVLWLGGLVLAGWVLIGVAEYADYQFGTWPDPAQSPEYLGPGQSAALSASNVFAFLRFNRTFLNEEIATLTAFSEVVAAAQTVLGLILVFLLGLTLRNRFRIK